MKFSTLTIAVAFSLLVAACGQSGAGGGKAGNLDATRLTAASGTGDWMSVGRTYDEQRFSPLTKIDTTNVNKLGLAWYHEFDTDRGQEATPVMIDGVLYTTTAWSKVYAFNAKTGELKWSYDPKVEGSKAFDACCDVVNRGVAVWKGRVYVGALDGRLIALDAGTGKEVWSVQTTDTAKPYTITGAPRIIKDKVLIGNGGAEYGVRGYVTAYDAATGKKVWRFYTAPNAEGKADGEVSDKILKDKVNATWFDGAWKQTGGGATIWDSMAYDPVLDIVYLGVGNGSPWNNQKRSGGKGDTLFVSSILALKPDTGEYVWHYQTTPGESWDYTATQHIMLADLTIDGKPRKVAMQAPKNGFFYVLDRATGELISAKNFVPITWATGVDMKTGRPVETPGARYETKPSLALPGPLGAHNWHPMAFNPKEGLVYIPAQASPFAYTNTKDFKYNSGGWNVGTDLLANALPTDKAKMAGLKSLFKGQLIAWDPVAQKARWTVEHPYFWNAGIMSTAGGLVFQGAGEGQFIAYDAANGKKLWNYETVNGVIAAPSTYEIDGEQYVAVMVGYGGGGPISASVLVGNKSRLPGRLMVFKLGGATVAKAYDIPAVAALDLTKINSTGDVTRGFARFHENCQVCHGPSASGAYLPDLRKSQMITTADNFKSVVIDGARKANGMASFAKYLKPEDAEDIRAYVISEAHRAQVDAALAVKSGGAKGG